MVGPYLDIFHRLGFHRRGVIFCYCMLKSYPKMASLRKRLLAALTGHLNLLYKKHSSRPENDDLKGYIYRFESGNLAINADGKYFVINHIKSNIKLGPGQQTRNWSYFSLTKTNRAYLVETGFVLDGYPRKDLSVNPDYKNSMLGIFFDQWLAQKKEREGAIFRMSGGRSSGINPIRLGSKSDVKGHY